MLKLTRVFVATAAAAAAQTVYFPVNAPYAQDLVVATKNAHPELQKLGLHAIPPGQSDYAIIANAITSKIGKKSSAADLTVVRTGKAAVKRDEAGKFFDLCLPIADSSERPIGITVLEIPFAFAKDTDDALAKAAAVRDQMQAKIASHAQLFEATNAPLKALDIISLPAAVKGRFDHFGVDLKHNRLFATPEDYHAVLVLDLVSGKPVAEIPGIAKPHAVLYREDLDRIFVTDGEEGALKIFDGKTYQPAGAISLAKDADSIGYDAASQRLYVVNGGKDASQPYSLVSVIDTAATKKVADIRIDGETLEAMALDAFRPRLYINNRARNQVTVVDRWKNTVVASWAVKVGRDNVAMALDEAHQRLFVGCRSGHVAIFDSNTGKELQVVPIGKGVDDITYDPGSKRLYAIGGGTIDVLQEIDADHFRSIGSVAAGSQAKTGRLVPEINRYFAAIPQAGSGTASIQVLQPLNVPVAKLNVPAAKPVEASMAAQVHAPRALDLEMSILSAHPDLRKMGLHAIPPGGKESVIIANANTSRIGVPSSAGDLDAVKDGRTYCAKKDDGAFFNMKLPLLDASGNTIGILVMEIPFTSAADEAAAIRTAEGIRHELARQIPDHDWLFQ
jgi:DNA-binding beta-propeller fold protein YncE